MKGPRAPAMCGKGGPRIGLALGGGSARGLAHILVIEAFDELGLKPAAIVGTSMGAIFGAAYAAGLSAKEIRAEAKALLANRSAFVRRLAGKLKGGIFELWSVRAPIVVDGIALFTVLLPQALKCDFDALTIPFQAVATDFYAIEQVILDKGPLVPALAASSALPSLMRPVLLDGRVLIDGGFVNPTPYDVLMGRVDVTVAVDVIGTPRPRPGSVRPRTIEVLTGATQILFHCLMREKLKQGAPDILIRPQVGNFGAMDYFKIDDILSAGLTAKDELKRKLAHRLEAQIA
jgi:NTE family protein